MTSLQDVSVQQPLEESASPPHPQDYTNVSQTERWIAGVAGGLLVVPALLRPSSPGRWLLGLLGGGLLYRSYSGYCPGYAALGINTARQGSAWPNDYFRSGIHVEVAYTIQKPVEELYSFWRDFTHLPRFMRHLESVSCRSDRESHWVAIGPGGYHVEWDARIINEEPNRMIAWSSLPGADVDNSGSVWFVPAPGDRGSEVRVVLDYIPPAGRIGSTVAKLFGREPEQQIQEDLRRFKQLMEAGELPTTEGQPQGTCGGKLI